MPLERDDKQNVSESDLTIESSIPDWIVEHPESYRFFLDLGLNTFCGGTSLRYELERNGLDPEEVLKQLDVKLKGKSTE